MTNLDRRFGSCKIEMLTEKLRKKEGFFSFTNKCGKVLWKKRKRPVLNYLSYVEKLQNKIDFLSSDQGCDI